MSAKDTQDEKSKGVHPAAAALTGLAIGVAAGVAMTTLSDKDKREKLGKKVDGMGKQAKKSYDEMSDQVGKLKNKVSESIDETGQAARRMAGSVKQSGDKVADQAQETAKVVDAEVEDVVEEGKKGSK